MQVGWLHVSRTGQTSVVARNGLIVGLEHAGLREVLETLRMTLSHIHCLQGIRGAARLSKSPDDVVGRHNERSAGQEVDGSWGSMRMCWALVMCSLWDDADPSLTGPLTAVRLARRFQLARHASHLLDQRVTS